MRFIVVPKNVGNGRQVMYEVIDTMPSGESKGLRAERARIGMYADENFAEGLAVCLTGAGKQLDSCVAEVDKKQSF